MRLGKEWKIERVINEEAPIYGSLKLTSIAPHKYLWEEAISTPLADGSVVEGKQAYQIERNGTNLNVYFASGLQKGSLFQSFTIDQPDVWHQHQCGEDLYKSRLKIVSRETIMIEHIVQGPRKDYRMRSVYK